MPFGYCKGLCSRCEDPNGPGYCPNVGQPDRSNGKVLIPHPIDSVAVKLAYESYITGDYSDATIADLLNAYEHRLDDGRVMHFRMKAAPDRFEARPFSTDAVRGLLQRVIYTGQVVYYGSDRNGDKRRRKEAHESYPGQHPALIDQAMFDRVQELRSLFSNNGRVRKGAPIQIYPLTGIVRCGYCGNHLRGISPHGHRYYKDASRIEHTVDCPQSLTRAEPIEQQVIDRLRLALMNIDVAASEVLTERLAAADLQVARAQELYLLGEIGRKAYDAAKQTREQLVENWGLHFSGCNATIPLSQIETAVANWSGTLPIEQKRLLRLVLEGVYVRGNAVVAVQPTLAFLPLLGKDPSCTNGPDGSGGYVEVNLTTQDFSLWSKQPGNRSRAYQRVFCLLRVLTALSTPRCELSDA